MDTKPMDITPREREFLCGMRSRAGMYTGRRGNISDLSLYISGMRTTASLHKLDDVCIIPEGFTKYLAGKYNESNNIGWENILKMHETDEYTAFDKFWIHLNEYLAICGYDPIEEIKPVYEEQVHKDGIADLYYHDIPKAAGSYMRTFNSEPWNDTWDIDTAIHRIKELFHSSRPYTMCIWNENKIIGGLFGRSETYFDGDVFQLVELWIEPEYQGKGYAGQLLSRLKNDLKKRGVKRVYLLTLHGNATEDFYKHNGFVTDSGMCVMNIEI